MVNIIDFVGKMTKIAASVIIFRIPVIGEFQFRCIMRAAVRLIFWCGQKNQDKTSFRDVLEAPLDEAKFVTIKIE